MSTLNQAASANYISDIAAGERLTVEISGYTHKGLGVARHGREVIFIPGALRGEKLTIELLQKRKGIWQAKILEVLSSSPERIASLCPVYDACGGCEVQHMSYAEECRFKTEQVSAALQRVGGLDISQQMRPVLAAEAQYNYRNTGIFHVVHSTNGAQLTFWAEGSHQAAGQSCRLLFPQIINSITEWLAGQDIPDNVTDVMLRCSHNQQSVMLVLRLASHKTQRAGQLLQRAAAEFAAIRVWGVQIGQEYRILSAEQQITTMLDDVSYQLSPAAFFQVNYRQTERMLQVIQSALTGKEEVLLDAYCGIGTLGIYLANKQPTIKQLVGVEVNAAAVENAKLNAANNGLHGARFYAGKAEERFDAILQRYQKVDAVIIDPPRAGCHKKLLQGLLKLAAPKIIYVSCNPATLARDLQLLCADMYRPVLVQLIDMFPRTHHVETVVILERKNCT